MILDRRRLTILSVLVVIVVATAVASRRTTASSAAAATPIAFPEKTIRKETAQASLVIPPGAQFQNFESVKPSRREFTIYRNQAGEIVCREATADEIKAREAADFTNLNLRRINHLELDKSISGQSPQANDLIIVLRATQQLQQNAAAAAAFTRAAQNWEGIIKSPITIYLDVDFGSTNFGQTWPSGVLGATRSPSGSYPYQSVRGNLIAEADGEGNPTKQAIFNALPSSTLPTDLGDAGAVDVSDSIARAIGLLPATAQSTDEASSIAFNSGFTFDFDPSDGITSGAIDFDAVATHEIGHALGFHSEAGLNIAKPSIWDLYRFRTGTTSSSFSTAPRILTIGGSPDPLQYDFIPGNTELGLSTGGPSGSTVNGGDGWQSSHWKHVTGCVTPIGIMDPAIPSGCRRTITAGDTLALASFGYNLTNSAPPPPPPPSPTPPANDNFANAAVVTGCSGSTAGSTFGATSEAGEPSHDPSDSTSLSPSHTIWYQWQAPSSGSTTITTGGSGFDTILAVYTGTTVNSLTRLAFNDDVQNGVIRTSSVAFSATSGTTYMIVVDGWAGDAGSVQLNWTGCGAGPTPTPTPTPSPTPSPTAQPCFSRRFLNDNGDSPDKNPGDGVCLSTDGVCTLRAAIQEANALTTCGTIDIDMGAITTVINLNTALPDLNHNVNLKGPVNSVLTIQRSTQVGTPNFRIFNVLSGRTVNISGGLILSNGNLTFGNNGAAILNSGTLNVDRVSVTGNTTVNGSAIFNNSTGALTITNSTIANNDGGGITNNQGVLNLTNSIVSSNTDTVGGAGVFNNGNMFLSNCTVSGNTVNGGGGGGILNNAGTAVVINSTVSSNAADAVGAGGGGIYNRATLQVVNSTISGNSASGSGGGGILNFNNATLAISNSTISNNRSGNGGGLNNGVATFSLKNTLVAGNTATNLGPDLLGSFNSLDFNLIGNTINGTLTGATSHNITNVNALLGPLADNGGSTMTHALLAGSPAINAGNNALAVDQDGNALTTDQRGLAFPRIINGVVDIGAFETTAAAPTPTPTPTPTATPTATPSPTPTPGTKPPCNDDMWIATNTTNAPPARSRHTAIWTGSEMIVWGGQDANFNAMRTGARYNPRTDSWTFTSPLNAPSVRVGHTAVWTGSEMIIFGGSISGANYFSDGARYNPTSDTWTPISTVNAPAARSGHVAVWTGSEMIVWGGSNNTGIMNTGARYNPQTDSWSPITNTNAPIPRFTQAVVWTGTEMIIWGGNGNTFTNTGGRYNPSSDSWTATSLVNAPSARIAPTAVWTGTQMIVWGGSEPAGVVVATGAKYNPNTDSWSPMANAPGPRSGHLAVWTGKEMMVWGGSSTTSTFSNIGERYNPATDTWIAACDTNAPAARGNHTLTWTGAETIAWGGNPSPTSSPLNTGGRYSIPANPIDAANSFVRRHYLDFLNREPDASGWDFWANQILTCGNDAQCTEVRRINVSAAFFLSIEFQETGNLVYKMYKVGFGNLPAKPVAVDRAPFLADTRQIQSTPAQVIVGQGNWQAQLETNKQAFALAFVQRPAFQTTHAGQDIDQYVNSLFANSGVSPTGAERSAAFAAFSAANNAAGANAGRAAALRSVAESASVAAKLNNEAFVLIQYFGYLQRNPYDPPEATLDYQGYNFWLGKLNQFNGDYIAAEMVKAFISSTEYRQRFGP